MSNLHGHLQTIEIIDLFSKWLHSEGNLIYHHFNDQWHQHSVIVPTLYV